MASLLRRQRRRRIASEGHRSDAAVAGKNNNSRPHQKELPDNSCACSSIKEQALPHCETDARHQARLPLLRSRKDRLMPTYYLIDADRTLAMTQRLPLFSGSQMNRPLRLMNRFELFFSYRVKSVAKMALLRDD